MTTTRPVTQSAPAVARTALDAARSALPAYSLKFPQTTYTPHQWLARLAVRELLRTEDRRPGWEQHPEAWSDLRAAMGLAGHAPDHATLQQAAGRPLQHSRPTPS